jgi:Xaa-Pro aminopeptidase
MKKSTAAILLIASPSESPDLVYSSGFWAPDPLVYLVTPKKRYLVVSRLEIGRARTLAANSKTYPPLEALTPEDVRVPKTGRGQLDQWALCLLRHIGLTRVSVPSDFPHGIAQRLEARGIRISTSREALFPKRQVKSPAEIACITESQQAAVDAMQSAVTMIGASSISRSGTLTYKGKTLRSEAVQRCIHHVLLDHNTVCGDVIVAGGAQGADPHERGSGPLRAHEPIVIDIFPRHMHHGYWGDITRTVLRGKATTQQKHMYNAVKAAHRASLTRVAPAVKCSSVHKASVDEFERRGFETGLLDGTPVGFIHSTGHGVGLAIHEAPSVSLSEARLKKGNVITIEPGLYYPTTGGFRIEDTVVVTAKGYRQLVSCEKRFEI